MLLEAGTGARRSNFESSSSRRREASARGEERWKGAGLLPLRDSSLGPSDRFIQAPFVGFQKAGTKKKKQELCETS